jgi:hypothetical protein
MPDWLPLVWLGVFVIMVLSDIVFLHYVKRVWLPVTFCFNCCYYPEQWSLFPDMHVLVSFLAWPMLLVLLLLSLLNRRFNAWAAVPMLVPGFERKTDDAER